MGYPDSRSYADLSPPGEDCGGIAQSGFKRQSCSLIVTSSLATLKAMISFSYFYHPCTNDVIRFLRQGRAQVMFKHQSIMKMM